MHACPHACVLVLVAQLQLQADPKQCAACGAAAARVHCCRLGSLLGTILVPRMLLKASLPDLHPSPSSTRRSRCRSCCVTPCFTRCAHTVRCLPLPVQVLALELLKIVLDGCGPTFRASERFLSAIRQYLCLSLLKNSASSVPQALQLCCAIFSSLMTKFRWVVGRCRAGAGQVQGSRAAAGRGIRVAGQHQGG
jgi:hypothetical protein